MTNELGVNLLNISKIKASDNQNEMFSDTVGWLCEYCSAHWAEWFSRTNHPSPTVTPRQLDKGLSYALIRPVVGTGQVQNKSLVQTS